MRGQLIPANDKPERSQNILAALAEGFPAAEEPHAPVPQTILEGVHDPALLHFLETLHDRWQQAYPGTQPFPETSIAPGMFRRKPSSLRGELSYFCFDTGTAVTAGTWPTVTASAACAHAAVQAILAGERSAFALCRPPGHHAGGDFYGGYCFLNTAAIAAQTWVATTGTRCAILDVDYHHGNGTQQIFYERDDVFFASLHATPQVAYPFFSGYAEERGSGRGLASNLNLPLAMEASWPGYTGALQQALEEIAAARPELLIVSLGTDTYRDDPVGGLGLEIEHFGTMSAQIRATGLPMAVIMEGGYHLPTVGSCVAAFLAGLRDAATLA